MLIRISLGIVLYVSISLFFKEIFDLKILGLSIFFVLLPLADWVPYLMIRKRYKLVSHYLWYYPLIYVPIGTLLIWIISKNGYFATLFTTNSLANFIHATFRTTIGVQWPWPFSGISISLENGLKIFSKEERNSYLEKKYQEYLARATERGRKNGPVRTVSEELSDRRHPKGIKTILFFVFSLILLSWFL